ncbi:unnamed protein product [Rotaria sordida]|uniref:Uncharacterized protein n=1 Tax=Rotaria sordida TaxID=392033 RepID=A0A814HMN1_9BILA|nr:unnamed protein product [Rotaria sordida]CAF1609151.1 unnamed protein product [Rotaria sordida]
MAGLYPPFNSDPQDSPGLESQMDRKPDYGHLSYNGSGKLQGKIAIITGGDSGIGRAVALAFAREGATVVISYLNETEDAEEIQAVIQKEGHEYILIPGDITDEA